MTQNTNNINSLKRVAQDSVFPIDMLSNVKICNMVSAMLLRDLYAYDSIDEYHPTKYEKTIAKDLYDKFRSYVSGRLLPGVEYSYVNYFISICNAKDYVIKENEEDFVQAHKTVEKDKKVEKSNKEFRSQPKDGENTFLTMRMAIYMLSALNYFEGIHPNEIRRIASDIARLGIHRIDPDKSGYRVNSIIGKEFGGYELLAYYYVSWAQVFPHELEAKNLPFSKAYALALQMYKGKK
ncbi:MAG: hypothetical protein LUC37_06985 [Prevotella sp.]|nr:hypothetical protein [Prevotella sp.]